MKSNKVLILWIGLLLGISGHSQKMQPYQNQQGHVQVIGNNNQTKCKIDCADPLGNPFEKGQLMEYYIELLPGSNFTGSWYYFNPGTMEDTSTANLVENPDVTWLTVSPNQFTDIGDGIATKVDFIFSTPFVPGTYSTIIVDLNGFWQEIFITLVVTTTPTLNVAFFNEQVIINEPFSWSYWSMCPAYFFWDEYNQYYFYNSMNVDHYEYPPQSWFSISPASFTFFPLDSTLVTYSATLTSAGNDSILIFKTKQFSSWPFYHKFYFDVTEPSYITLSPANQNVPSTGGTTIFSLESDTTWTISDNASWLTISPTNGIYDTTITATFTGNTTSSQRVATITATATGVSTPVTATVTQAPCSITVTPSNQNVSSQSGYTHFTVSTLCLWTATSNKSWCTVTGVGIGNGTITATYTSNTSTFSRTANITVSIPGLTQVVVTVTQAGTPVTCALNVSPANRSVTSPAGSTTFSVTSNCYWTAASNQTWCTVNTSGSGNDTITATYTENISAEQRTAYISVVVQGQSPVTVTVTQAGSTIPPGWTPVPNLQYSMSVIGKIQLSPGAFSANGNDIIGAFVGSECRGVANPVDSLNGIVYLTIGSNAETGSTVMFKVYLASTNEILHINETLAFQSGVEIGTTEDPYIFTFPMQNNVIIQGVTVNNGQSPCYNAYQTITVAGGGTSFLVKTGAAVNLIAGQKIKFLPGVTVQTGGYLIGSITNNSSFCNPVPASPKYLNVDETTIVSFKESPMSEAFPNPANGWFTLRINNTGTLPETDLRIFNMQGKMVLKTTLMRNNQEFSLENEPPGLYLICVFHKGTTEMVKILLQ